MDANEDNYRIILPTGIDKDLWEKILRHTVKVTIEKAGRDPTYASEMTREKTKEPKAGIFPAIAAYRKYLNVG